MDTSPTRLAPNTAAAITAVTAMAVPARALRTGTAVRPRPASNAIRTPIAPDTAPVLPSSLASHGRPVRATAGSAPPSGLAARAAARHAARASTVRGSSAITAAPAPRTARLSSTPGSGSASRAGPIGISGDAVTAITTASAAPVTVTMASLASESPVSVPRVAPRARSTGYPAASMAS